MKKFTINCDFGGQIAPFTIYIGQAEPGHHPLHFQRDWLSKERGGTIPAEVMDAIAKLKELADKNNVPLEELCVYALGTNQDESSEEEPKEESDKESNLEDAYQEELADEARDEQLNDEEQPKAEGGDHKQGT